ncbi:MAG: tetratricopeptide repeat protein [Planctomycetota bacterium]
MAKKTFLTALFLSGLLLCSMTEVCTADAAGQFEQAETHRRNGDYQQAEKIFKIIIGNYPGTEEALRSQRGLVIVYILTQRSYDAEAALNKLTTDFASYHEPNDVAQALFDIARQYEWSAKYKDANKVYQQILDEQPQSWYVNRADLGTVRTNILHLVSIGKDAEAASATDKLAADFGGHADLPQATFDIAKRYEWSQQYEQANDLYLQFVQAYPDSPAAGEVPLTVRRLHIRSLLESGQEAEAQAAIEKLISDYNDHPALPGLLDNIAHKYEWTGRYELARSLYQQISQQYPDSTYAGTARLEASKVHVLQLIEAGKDNEVQTALDKLTVDFEGYRSLASAVSRIAEQYQIIALRKENEGTASGEETGKYLSKAITIWERVINNYRDTIVVPQSCCYAGDCYRMLGEYEKSAECYQKVADYYPGNKMAWHALFMVARNYEDMKKAGTVLEAEADGKIKAAYERLLEKYPACKAAEAAKMWLNNNN